MVKCPKCDKELEKKKKSNINVVLLDDKDIEFLSESNKIEREYSKEALEDSKDAWRFAFKHKHMINMGFIKIVHQELMKNLDPTIAGNIRECKVWVGNRECLDYKKIDKALSNWIKTYSKLKKSTEIKEAHIKFEEIHPFEDGNGRTGRILMNIQRLNAGLPLLIIHEGEEQMEYYKWFTLGKLVAPGEKE